MRDVLNTDDADVIEGYLTDASNTRGTADRLVIPRSTAEVSAVVAHCQTHAIPLTVTAQRTSTTGGPVPSGGWLLSMEKLNRVHAPDDVDGGVILGAHQAELLQQGLYFPPDPTSRHECSVGAAIACNASGARSFRYGSARPWVKAVEWVLPTGEVRWVDRDTPIPAEWPRVRWTEPGVKTAAGFFPADNALDLVIGSEGALGVITRAKLKLDRAPDGVLGLIVFFPDEATTVAFVNEARRGANRRGVGGEPGALSPTAIEYFDHHALRLASDRIPDLPAEARAALFIEVEHHGEPPLDQWWDAIVASDALADHTIVADDETGRRRLHAVRHAIPASVNETVVANGMPKVGTDFAVPDSALEAIMAVYQTVTLPSVCFGHIGDNHLHLNLLPRTPEELATARAEYVRLAHEAVRLGGTVSAEHGIGKIKRSLLADMVGPDVLESFQRLKHHLDPNWVLGRGTMLAPPSEGLDISEAFRVYSK
ncbi:MAG: FAD-binding oxidoreductase [Myxococcota bacterium]|nr:FAD-binding oxidoreductase [Myxococcota bacterium]MEC9389199.1 FAD-binding oxidoreductase [Myxococcota bacterium]